MAFHSTEEAEWENQPLLSGDGTVFLVADLRLDNRDELAQQLSDLGLLEEGKAGDAEIALAAYSRWGVDFLHRMVGDFALVLWDRQTRSLLCARDVLGVKPLFYSRIGSRLCFASEVRQILEHPDVSKDLENRAIANHLVGWPAESDQSFFQAVRKVRPGYWITFFEGGERESCYWDPEAVPPIRYEKDEDYAAHLRDLIRSAVSDRLRTNGTTVGLTLSGGLDSSCLAAVARPLLPGIGPPKLLACSFVFNRLQDCDESAYIQPFTRHMDLEAALVPAEEHWLLSNSAEDSTDPTSPFRGWDECYSQVYRRLKSEGAKVLLTGHGADDLLRGSSLVYLDRLLRGDLAVGLEVLRHGRAAGRGGWRSLYRYLGQPLLPQPVKQAVRTLLGRWTASVIPSWISPKFAQSTGLTDRVEARFRSRGKPPRALHRIRSAVTENGFERAVDWHDRSASRWAIEARHPFLDRRILEFVLAIPPEQLFQLDWYKPLLRRAMKGVLPEGVRLRKDKTRLGRFIDFSLCEKESARVKTLLCTSLAAKMGILDSTLLQDAYLRYCQGERREYHRTLWFAVTLEMWLRRVFPEEAAGLSKSRSGMCRLGKSSW